MVKPIQELEQVAERLMQQAYQSGRAKSSDSSHRRCRHLVGDMMSEATVPGPKSKSKGQENDRKVSM
ncbi:hypothetical protein ACB092_02G169700 [Castanea dentata]